MSVFGGGANAKGGMVAAVVAFLLALDRLCYTNDTMQTLIARIHNALRRVNLVEAQLPQAIDAYRGAMVDLLTVVLGQLEELNGRLDDVTKRLDVLIVRLETVESNQVNERQKGV